MSPLRRAARSLVLPFRDRFRQTLEDPHAPLSLDMDHDSPTLLVAFGGMAGQLGMPPFEFFKATGEIPVKRLFVRDLHQAWYHRGIPGHGSTLETAAASLGELIAGRDVERLVVAGNSAGGYAALVFGTLLGADAALCFAPQSILELDALAEMDDHRWDDQLLALVRAGQLDARWTDLRSGPAASSESRHDLRGLLRRGAARRSPARRASRRPGRSRAAPARGRRAQRRPEMRETGELAGVLRRVLVAESAPGTASAP